MKRIKPFRICGNIWFVGTEPASTHLIHTEEGLILIDPGYPHSLHHVVESVWESGFDVRDIRVILISHGHYDHLGAVKPLLELCPQAKTYLGQPDEQYANGTLDLTYAKELGYDYMPYAFRPDVLLNDGDTVSLGSTSILCLSAPGHTPGTMAFFFNTEENGVVYRAGMHGGVGVNSMCANFLNRHHLSFDCRDQFKSALERLKSEHVDVPLGNHVGCNDTLGKAARIGQGENPFINPDEWIPFLERRKRLLDEQIAAEFAEAAKKRNCC